MIAITATSSGFLFAAITSRCNAASRPMNSSSEVWVVSQAEDLVQLFSVRWR